MPITDFSLVIINRTTSF